MEDLNPDKKFSTQKDQLLFPAKVGVDSPLYSDRVSPDFLMHRVKALLRSLLRLSVPPWQRELILQFPLAKTAHSGVTRAATLTT
jgi:hypothetical protein